MDSLSTMIDVPTLDTPRLTLRAWHDDDRLVFAAMNADPHVMEHFPRPLTLEESNAFVDRIIEHWRRGFGLWAVERRDSGTFIGFVGFSQPAWSASFTPCVEIGWRLTSSAWGQGLATEGATAALAWARDHVDFPRGEVVSFTTVANARSRRVMEKLGMTHDESADFDHPLLPEWPQRRHVLYRMAIRPNAR